MPNTLLHNKAEILKNKAHCIGQALQMIDNTELDLAPEVNRVALSGACLPGFTEGTFSGQAEFQPGGAVLSIGIRHRAQTACTDLIVKRQACSTRVTERRYFEGHSVTLTINAVFSLVGELLLYEELF